MIASITNRILSGANPKVIQVLARHSTITLTLDRYTTLGDDDARDALEGRTSPGPDASTPQDD